MTLQYQIETLDGVDEAAQSFYKEAESGGYVLQVEGVVPKSQFEAVNQKAVDATEEARRRRATVERVTSKLGLEDASGLDEALDGLLTKGKGKSEDTEAIVEQIKAQYEGKLSEAQKRLSGIVKKGAQSELKAALAAARFHPEIVDDIAATAMGRVDIDESGNMRIMQANRTGPLAGSGPDGYATFADLAAELAAAKPSFLVNEGKGGGGKPPASGSSGGPQTVSRSQFDAMSQSERATFSKSGGKVVDG